MKRKTRQISRGMSFAAWATIGHVGSELLVLALTAAQSAPARAFVIGTAVEMSAVVGLGVLMFQGVGIAYVVMGAYGIVRLLLGALAVDAVMIGEMERVDPLLVWGILIAMPFALAWVVGVWAVWRAGRRRAVAARSGVRAA